MADATQRDLKNVMVIALADGQLTEDEKQFIQRLRQRLGLDEQEFADLVAQVRADPKAVSLPKEAAQAVAAVRLIADAAAADGEIGGVEKRIIRRLAAHVQLPPSELESLLGGSRGPEEAADTAELEGRVEEIYAGFAEWDDSQRARKIEELGAYGPGAVRPLLQMLESYRTPAGLPDALALKALVARQLGRLGDGRAVYYLAQHVSLGDIEDEITSADFRCACAEAMGRIVGESFSADAAGVAAAREWWTGPGRTRYSTLAI
jgi:uncharacterized tellurite resistance protein B-like protein